MLGYYELTVGLIVLVLLFYAALTRKYLTLHGSIAGVVIGVAILAIGGIRWLIPLIVFMLLGSLSTRAGRKMKNAVRARDEADRGLKNVMANGIPPLVFAVLLMISSRNLWSLAYTASIASATSDTFSTELGLLSGALPRRISRPGELVKRGFSGGITPLGLISGVIAAATIGLLAAGVDVIRSDPRLVSVAVVSGFAGDCIDSLMGDVLQAKYVCNPGGHLVEEKDSCGGDARLVSGCRFINNHVVNFVSNLLAGFLAISLIIWLSPGWVG